MIVILTTANHRYTHRAVEKVLPLVKAKSYETMFRSRTAEHATYIFTDFDRLGFWELELAADLYRLLGRAGCRVLNDPARVLLRYALLKRLQSTGINEFGAWRADEGVLPDRFPVFLRTQAAHRGVISGLLHDVTDAHAALDDALDNGHPLSGLMFIEYCAEPTETGLFWKHSVYKVGDELFAGPSVLDVNWMAKNGVEGLATDEQLRFEQELVHDRRFVELLRPSFDVAAVGYGRVDFAMVKGKPAVYEINTNPYMALSIQHRSPIRAETLTIVRESYLCALNRLDVSCASGRRIPVLSDRFEQGWRRCLQYRLRTP